MALSLLLSYLSLCCVAWLKTFFVVVVVFLSSYGLWKIVMGLCQCLCQRRWVFNQKKKKNNVATSFTCSREALYYDLILGSLSWRIRLELLLYIIQEYSLNRFAFFPLISLNHYNNKYFIINNKLIIHFKYIYFFFGWRKISPTHHALISWLDLTILCTKIFSYKFLNSLKYPYL